MTRFFIAVLLATSAIIIPDEAEAHAFIAIGPGGTEDSIAIDIFFRTEDACEPMGTFYGSQAEMNALTYTVDAPGNAGVSPFYGPVKVHSGGGYKRLAVICVEGEVPATADPVTGKLFVAPGAFVSGPSPLFSIE